MGLARTLNRGSAQGYVGASTLGVAAPTTSSSSGGVGIIPHIQGGGRYGLTDHVELGASIGSNLIGIDGKFALLRSPTMESGLNLSINPTLSGGFISSTSGSSGGAAGVMWFSLPVLIGIDFSGHELVIGPRVVNGLFFGGGGSSSAVLYSLLAGGSVGVAFRLGDVLRLMPEVSVVAPVVAAASASSGGMSGSGSVVGGNGVMFQAGLTLMFGGQYDPPPPPWQPPPPPPGVGGAVQLQGGPAPTQLPSQQVTPIDASGGVQGEAGASGSTEGAGSAGGEGFGTAGDTTNPPPPSPAPPAPQR